MVKVWVPDESADGHGGQGSGWVTVTSTGMVGIPAVPSAVTGTTRT